MLQHRAGMNNYSDEWDGYLDVWEQIRWHTDEAGGLGREFEMSPGRGANLFNYLQFLSYRFRFIVARIRA